MNKERTLLQTVRETVREHNMIESGEKVLAAVSGGADSVCMLHVLNRLKKELGFEIICAHLNHGIRGEAADEDEAFVEKLCIENKIPFFSKKVDVPEIAKSQKLTEEEAGRIARYE